MTQEAVGLLAGYLRINTTNPPGNEAAAADFFSAIFHREKINFTTYESAPGRVSLRAIIRGAGEKEPLILLNHMDVVPADPDAYSFDPFGGEIRNGYICGRGALDMKGIGIMQLMAFMEMKRKEVSLNRDLIFLAVADEEEGGTHGVKYLLDNYPDDFRAGLVINEGGYGIADLFPGKTVMFISPAEKGFCWLRLSRKGPSGHASIPHSGNALEKMIQGVNRVLSAELPVIITPTVREYFNAVASEWAFLGPYMEDGKEETLIRVLKESGMLAVPQLNAMVRNTISLTMFSAGDKINVIPGNAEARLDVRLLPGQEPDKFIDFIRELLGDDEIIIEKLLSFPGNVSDTGNEDFNTLQAVLHESFPGSLTPLYLLSGISDSRFFREKGVNAYGFCPVVIPMQHLAMVHGTDEKILVDDLVKGSEIYTDIVRRLCT